MHLGVQRPPSKVNISNVHENTLLSLEWNPKKVEFQANHNSQWMKYSGGKTAQNSCAAALVKTVDNA